MSSKSFYTIIGVICFITISVFLVVCILTAVDRKSSEIRSNPKEDESKNSVLYKEVYFDTNKWMYRISKVEFEDHTYIVLEDNGSAAILHDPDCQCQTQK